MCIAPSNLPQENRAFLTEMLFEYCTYPVRRVSAFHGVRTRLFRQHRIVQQFASSSLVDRRRAESAGSASTRPFDLLGIILEPNPTDRSRHVRNVTMTTIAGLECFSEALASALYEIYRDPKGQLYARRPHSTYLRRCSKTHLFTAGVA